MKKMLFLITGLMCLSIVLFIVFTNANYTKLTESEALEIGEEKYLQFLWMVDGAFNSERLNGDFTVNGKKLDDENKLFTCTYINKKDNNCIGNNFEEEFHKLFASNIYFKNVYGDGLFYTWYKYENGKYIFTYLDNCSTTRMNLEQSIRLKKIDNSKLVFRVASENSNHQQERVYEFILLKEENTWKVSKAYYYDICEMDYNIG